MKRPASTPPQVPPANLAPPRYCRVRVGRGTVARLATGQESLLPCPSPLRRRSSAVAELQMPGQDDITSCAHDRRRLYRQADRVPHIVLAPIQGRRRATHEAQEPLRRPLLLAPDASLTADSAEHASELRHPISHRGIGAPLLTLERSAKGALIGLLAQSVPEIPKGGCRRCCADAPLALAHLWPPIRPQMAVVSARSTSSRCFCAKGSPGREASPIDATRSSTRVRHLQSDSRMRLEASSGLEGPSGRAPTEQARLPPQIQGAGDEQTSRAPPHL